MPGSQGGSPWRRGSLPSFAAKLFDQGKIPSSRAGTYRRALARDVLAYRDQEQTARRAALDELAAEGQRLNL